MKKLRGVIATLTVIGVCFLCLFAVQVSADVDKAVAAECTNGTKYTDFDGSYSGRDTMTVWPKQPLCKDANVNFSSFTINNDYNGQGFSNNPTALPQTLFYNKTVTLKKGTTSKITVKVSVPDACKDYQIDAYIGPVQQKITTSAGLADTTAIVGKAFQRLQKDCSPKTVKVCNPATGQIITVPESEADKYKPVGDVACKSVKVCDPKTGKIVTVKQSEADNYKPTGDKACQPVKVCDPETGKIIVVNPTEADKYKPVGDDACKSIEVCRLSDKTIVTIKALEYDAKKHSKDLADCKPVTPNKVNVCNPATGEIIQVDEADADQYKPVGDTACKNIQVCDSATGQIITVKKAKASDYKPVNDASCTENPETPSTPQVMGEATHEAPTEIPSTGPEQAITAVMGVGSLAGAGTAYIRSRRNLHN